MVKSLIIGVLTLKFVQVWGAAAPSSTSTNSSNETACVDNMTWNDSLYGDGTTNCHGMKADASLCKDHGNYSTEASKQCPVACGTCVQTPTEEWAQTLKVARGQAMLTQKMSKEFLLVAKKIEKEKYKKIMAGTIQEFDIVAHDLLTGKPERYIKAPPNEFVLHELEEVEAKWMIFKKLLEDNIATADKASLTTLNALSAQSLELLELSDTVVSHLEDAARASGAITIARQVIIAIRQDTFIYKMAVEAYLIGLGADVAHNLEYLEDTIKLFDDSHRGIIDGAEWAGIPTLEKFCTLYEMRDASYEWSHFKPLVDRIIAQKEVEESIAVALEEAEELAVLSGTLYNEMAEAAKLYEKDDGSCDHLYEITYSEWVYLIDNAGTQRYYGQQVSRLFTQIANQVRAAESKVDLTVTMTDTYNHLRMLLEGDKANNIPSAPSQIIAHELYIVYKSWVEMQALIEGALRTGDYTNALTVSQVAELSRQILTEMDKTAYEYEDRALYAYPLVPGHFINVAGTQRKLFEKMSKEAALAAFGEDPSANGILMNETITQFHQRHWELLKGAPGTVKYDPIPETSRICMIQQMKNVSDHFDVLEEAVRKVAAGSIDDIEVLIVENPPTYVAMDDAVKMYTAFAAPTDKSLFKLESEFDYVTAKLGEAEQMCTAIMDSLVISTKEWKETVVKSVQMQTLLEQAQAEYLLQSVTSMSTDKLQLERTVEEMQQWVNFFVYGKGMFYIPAAPSQELFDQMKELEGTWDTFKPKLQSESRRLAATDIGTEAADMTKQTSSAVTEYMSLAGQDEEVPVQRLYIASNQKRLLQKMTKEALVTRLGTAEAKEDSRAVLTQTITEFENAQGTLRNGGGGIQGIIPEREDLIELQDKVDSAWTAFKLAVEEVADDSTSDLTDMKTKLADVSKQVDEAIPAFGEPDPFVPEKPPPFPWTVLIFAIMGFIVLCVIVGACCVAGVCRGGGSSSSKGKDSNNHWGADNDHPAEAKDNKTEEKQAVEEEKAPEPAEV